MINVQTGGVAGSGRSRNHRPVAAQQRFEVMALHCGAAIETLKLIAALFKQ